MIVRGREGEDSYVDDSDTDTSWSGGRGARVVEQIDLLSVRGTSGGPFVRASTVVTGGKEIVSQVRRGLLGRLVAGHGTKDLRGIGGSPPRCYRSAMAQE